jgi:hypothetical protein
MGTGVLQLPFSFRKSKGSCSCLVSAGCWLRGKPFSANTKGSYERRPKYHLKRHHAQRKTCLQNRKSCESWKTCLQERKSCESWKAASCEASSSSSSPCRGRQTKKKKENKYIYIYICLIGIYLSKHVLEAGASHPCSSSNFLKIVTLSFWIS